MATDVRVSQAPIETLWLESTATDVRVSQAAIEAAWHHGTAIGVHVSQVAIEVLSSATASFPALLIAG